jgi:hypothetical protein
LAVRLETEREKLSRLVITRGTVAELVGEAGVREPEPAGASGLDGPRPWRRRSWSRRRGAGPCHAL